MPDSPPVKFASNLSVSRLRPLGLTVLMVCLTQETYAMGLRSFVALPVDKGGSVVRLFLEHNQDADVDLAVLNFAYGISHTQTALFGLPYRLSPGGSNQMGDLSALYRHIVLQSDRRSGTSRLGLLGGAIIPTDSERDPRLQFGGVFTLYQGRYEWDVDALYLAGLDDAPDAARYDVSWQYRITPAEYPDWGIGTEWDAVFELNGRWSEGSSTVHQLTLGLQWIHPRWILEGGITQDLNGPEHTRYLLSTRIHF